MAELQNLLSRGVHVTGSGHKNYLEKKVTHERWNDSLLITKETSVVFQRPCSQLNMSGWDGVTTHWQHFPPHCMLISLQQKGLCPGSCIVRSWSAWGEWNQQERDSIDLHTSQSFISHNIKIKIICSDHKQQANIW